MKDSDISYKSKLPDKSGNSDRSLVDKLSELKYNFLIFPPIGENDNFGS